MATDLVVPQLGESITEAVIARWLKKVGEATKPDEPVVDLETDKITVQLPAPAAGVLAEQTFAEGATVKVGQVIGKIKEGAAAASKPVKPEKSAAAPTVPATPVAKAAAAAPTPTPTPTPPPNPTPQPQNGHGRADYSIPPPPVLSPARRKALREQGLDPAQAALGLPAQTSQSPAVSEPQPEVSISSPAAEEIVPMTPLRKRIAERLVQVQHTAAILTTFNEVDMSAIMSVRARFQDQFVEKHGIKLGFMSFFVKAVIAALQQHPGLNAEVRGNDIVYKHYYNIGVAVGSGRGLVVPVMRNSDKRGFAEIEQEIVRLGQKARDNKLTLEDLAGGTFTISNGGIYGSMMSTPLLNYTQTGILGMHNIVKRPVVVAGDKIEIRPMMYLALSYDHRVVDGREAVQFLVAVKERLETPERMLINV